MQAWDPAAWWGDKNGISVSSALFFLLLSKNTTTATAFPSHKPHVQNDFLPVSFLLFNSNANMFFSASAPFDSSFFVFSSAFLLCYYPPFCLPVADHLLHSAVPDSTCLCCCWLCGSLISLSENIQNTHSHLLNVMFYFHHPFYLNLFLIFIYFSYFFLLGVMSNQCKMTVMLKKTSSSHDKN